MKRVVFSICAQFLFINQVLAESSVLSPPVRIPVVNNPVPITEPLRLPTDPKIKFPPGDQLYRKPFGTTPRVTPNPTPGIPPEWVTAFGYAAAVLYGVWGVSQLPKYYISKNVCPLSNTTDGQKQEWFNARRMCLPYGYSSQSIPNSPKRGMGRIFIGAPKTETWRKIDREQANLNLRKYSPLENPYATYATAVGGGAGTAPEGAFPLSESDVLEAADHIPVGKMNIRQVVGLANQLERKFKVPFMHMELGVPGLDPDPVATEGVQEAWRNHLVLSQYPDQTGISELKKAGGEFAKQFMNIEIPEDHVFATNGSMQGTLLAQSVVSTAKLNHPTILFIGPGFSVQFMQNRLMGLKMDLIDMDLPNWLDHVETRVKQGDVGGILYSTPNNPTWRILSEEEMQRLAKIADDYKVTLIEDSAYFGMDSRMSDAYYTPGSPPYPTTAAKYTDRWIILLSGSKIFSIAGLRIGLAFVSPALDQERSSLLRDRFDSDTVSGAFSLGLYSMTSGVSTPSQKVFAALLNSANSGQLDLKATADAYAAKAAILKPMFLENGFRLVYDRGGDGRSIADGFFFTVDYPGLNGEQLMAELIRYGIATTTLKITGSVRDGIRICVSKISENHFGEFRRRIEMFHRDHP